MGLNLCEAWIRVLGLSRDLYLPFPLASESPGALLVCVPTGVLALVVCSLSSWPLSRVSFPFLLGLEDFKLESFP